MKFNNVTAAKIHNILFYVFSMPYSTKCFIGWPPQRLSFT